MWTYSWFGLLESVQAWEGSLSDRVAGGDGLATEVTAHVHLGGGLAYTRVTVTQVIQLRPERGRKTMLRIILLFLYLLFNTMRHPKIIDFSTFHQCSMPYSSQNNGWRKPDVTNVCPKHSLVRGSCLTHHHGYTGNTEIPSTRWGLIYLSIWSVFHSYDDSQHYGGWKPMIIQRLLAHLPT